MRGHSDQVQARKSDLTRNQPYTLILDFQRPPEKINHCCLSHPVYSILLRQPEQAKTLQNAIQKRGIFFKRRKKGTRIVTNLERSTRCIKWEKTNTPPLVPCRPHRQNCLCMSAFMRLHRYSDVSGRRAPI